MPEKSEHDSPIQLQGQFLLADPSLRDGIFDRAVVFLADHSPAEGAFGLILNRPTGHTVGELLQDFQFEPLRHVAVHFGGPVAREQLTFSAFWWKAGKGFRSATRISADDAVKRSKQPGTLVRAFVGYSGWTAGQLETELRRNAWIVTRPPGDVLALDHDKALWSQVLRHLSPFHRVLAEAPDDPFLN